MNKIYKIIWSKAKNCFVVASELAKNHTKSPRNAVVGSEFEDNIMLSLCNSAVCSPVFSTGFIQPVKVNQVGSLPNVENYDFKITVAAIVKNEAKNVPTWVKAARSCADEIVVVDTGSTDGTVERFAEYGIECYHYEWQDDFAAAKNYMISLCHGDWIVLLDGDEWFREDCNVRKAIAKHHGNPIVKAIISDWICLDTTRNNTIMFSGGAVRAFRNQPDVRYFRKVHENLTINYENFVFEPELKLYHTGYSGDVNRSKHERNLRIMRTMFDFDNGKVEFPTDWRYVQDTYAGLGDFEKSLWASDKMLEFNVPDYSAASWITRFNVLFAMKTDVERMKKEFEYCFKTVPTVSGFRFLAAIYYIRNNMVSEGLNQYIEGMRMLIGPQDKVAMEHSYWRMYMPEASALVSSVYLRNQKYEAALYACKVCEAYCGKTNWTNMAFADIYRVLPSFYGISTFDIRSNFLNLFNAAKKGILAAALISTLVVGMVQPAPAYADNIDITTPDNSEPNIVTNAICSIAIGSCNTVVGVHNFVLGICNDLSGSGISLDSNVGNVTLIGTANKLVYPQTPYSTSAVGIGNWSWVGAGSVSIGSFVNNTDEVTIDGAEYGVVGQDTVAIGDEALTQGDMSVAVGRAALAKSEKSVSIGLGAHALGLRSIAIGACSQVDADYSVVIGENAWVEGYCSVGVGAGVHISGECSVAVGDNSVAYEEAVAIGNHAAALTGSVAIGRSSYTDASDSVSLGINSVVEESSGTALGSAAYVTAENSVALGADSAVSCNNTVSVGHLASDVDRTGNAYGSDMTRRIVNVSDGTAVHDASTVGQTGSLLSLSGSTLSLKTATGATLNSVTLPSGSSSGSSDIHLYAGNGAACNVRASNGQMKLTVADGTTVKDSVLIQGVDHIEVFSDNNGNVTILKTPGGLIGGENGVASGDYSTVSGGWCNTASADSSSVSGGVCNEASADDSSISGGSRNTAAGCASSISGGECNYTTGYGSLVSGGCCNTASGMHSFVGGGECNTASGDVSMVVGGLYNVSDSYYSLVAGGSGNTATSHSSTVVGGACNTASGETSLVVGGFCNNADGVDSVAVGGCNGVAYANFSTVIGGGIAGNASCVLAAQHSVAIGHGAVTTKDYEVTVGSSCASVTIGGNLSVNGTNTVSDGTTTVNWSDLLSAAGGGSASALPGCNNTASGCYSYVSGGAFNTASGGCSSISGGNSNQTNALYTSITAGCNNLAGRWGYYFEGNPAVLKFTNPTNTSVNENPVIATVGEYASVHGGACNYALGNNSSILGGTQNAAIGQYSTISGGQCNAALGSYSNIVGGTCNTAKADQSVMIGGNCNISDHYYYYFDENDYAQTIPAECAVIIGHCVQVGDKTYNAFDAPACNSVSVGGQCNKVSGKSSVIVAGLCNLNVGYNSGIVGGSFNVTSGSEDVIVGGNHNIVSSSESVVVSGQNNSIYGLDSVIAGGQCNSIDNTTWHGSIFGGGCNSIIADVGQGNWSEGATIVGGLSNNIYEHGDYAVAVGGTSNYVYAPYSATVGGGLNSAEGEGGIVVGGSGNILGNSENYSVDGFYSVLVGGECNIAKGEYTALFGGKCNVVSSCHSVVVGGYCNVAGQVYYYIDDNNKTHYIYGHSDDIYQGEIGDSSDEDYYWGNVIDVGDKTYPVYEYSAVEASVFGGARNKSFGTDSTIVGGSTNFTEGVYSVITGGTCNTSRGYASMIAGGNCNIATGCFATVTGGKDGQAYAKYSTVIGGAIAGCLSNSNIAQHSVAIGKQAQTTQDFEVAIGSQCAPVTIGGDLTVTSKIHGVTAGTADTDAVNVGQMNQALADLGISELDALAIKYDSNTKERATFGGSQGTVLGNLKAGAISATSMEAINGSQLYAVKQDIAGFATDIARNSENIRTMNASVTSALSSVAASGLLVDTMDATKADSSLNNLTDSGKRVLKQYAETAVQEYMASQQNNSSAPMAPMLYSNNSNTLTVTDAGNGSLHVGEGSYVNGSSSIAIGVGNQVNANNSGAFGDPSIINADASYVLGNDDTINTGATGSFIVGNDGISDAKGGLLFGSNTKATANAEDGVALGNNTQVFAKNAVALGSSSIADTENTISVGNDTLKRRITNVAEGNVTEDSSDVVTGSQLFITNEKVQKNTEAIEKKADADASNIDVKEWVTKLGVGKVENGNTDLVTGGAVYDAMKDIKVTSDFVKENNGIISIAPNSTATKIDIKNSSGEGRVITGVVTDVNDVSSAANVGYVNSVATNVANEVNRGFNKMNDRIDKVGAGAAAMAGLVPGPMDGDEKWSISAAVGNYRSATAGAVGAFYKPTDNVMVAVKGSFGSDENMVSGGVGISLNKGNVPGVSKAQMVRTINAQAGQIQQQANEIQNMKVAHQAEISNLQAQISALAAKVNEMQK